MATRQRKKPGTRATLRVGERVGVTFGGRVRSAVIVEDRGNLGVEGERVVRVHVDVGNPKAPDHEFEVELPISMLDPAPS